MKLYRQLVRNLMAYLGDGYTPEHVPFKDLSFIDKFIMYKLVTLTQEITKAYESCDVSTVFKSILQFSSVYLADFYLETVKHKVMY
jgi:isoleucyl-tRNA synthetase